MPEYLPTAPNEFQYPLTCCTPVIAGTNPKRWVNIVFPKRMVAGSGRMRGREVLSVSSTYRRVSPDPALADNQWHSSL
jgi:hypothetical protein